MWDAFPRVDLSFSRSAPLLISAVAALSVSRAAAQSYRLSDSFPPSPLWKVDSYRLSPDGTRVVFVAKDRVASDSSKLFSAALDADSAPIDVTPPSHFVPGVVSSPEITSDGSRVVCLFRDLKTHLYSVPLHGGAAVALSRNVANTRDVIAFAVSPDGQRVVYLADEDTNDVFELYSIPVDGSVPALKLSPTLPPNGDVASGFQISPDGSRVVYRANPDGELGLYSAPIDASSASVRLDRARPLSSVESDFRIAFDSLGVVYRADQDVNDVPELYAVSIDGSGPPAKRNGPLVAGGKVVSFELSALDDRLIYLADQEQEGIVELYGTRAITGGTPIKLSGSLVPGGVVAEAHLGADAAHVAYLVHQELRNELYGVPADGSSPAVKLHPDLASGQTVLDFELAPSGDRVLFLGGSAAGIQLFSTTLEGGPAILLDGLPVSLTGLELQDVGGDGTVLYTCDREIGGLAQLYRVPADGSSAPVKVNAPLHSGQTVRAATLDGARVVYQTGPESGGGDALFVAGASGRVRQVQVPMGDASGHVDGFTLSSQGSRAVYLASDNGFQSYLDLFGVPTDGSRSAVRLNQPLSGGAFIGAPVISADERRVVYTIYRPASSSTELQSAPIDAAHASVRLDAPLDSYLRNVSAFAITPDSTRVVFLADQDTLSVEELYVAPIDGSQPPLRLHPPLGAQESIDHFALSPDGEWVVYSLATPGGRQAYSVPLDAHQPPVRLNAPLVSGGNVGGDQDDDISFRYAITPDSTRVIYMADQDTDDVTELYGVPIDGSQGPTKLNALFAPGGELVVNPLAPSGYQISAPFLVSPDGSRVVYRADQVVDGKAELFSVPVDGSAPAVRLSGAMVDDGDVRFFAIDPSSTRVVYEANAEDAGRVELYSAPLDGSAPPVKLNGALVAGGNVGSHSIFRGPAFRISALGRVVYLADQSVDEVFELFSVPSDASSAAVRVSGPLGAGGDVSDAFELTVDGASVIYSADALRDEVLELFSAALDTSRPIERISAPMISGVPSAGLALDGFRVSADGQRVIYRAQQYTPLQELYAGLLSFTRGPRHAGAPTRMVVR